MRTEIKIMRDNWRKKYDGQEKKTEIKAGQKRKIERVRKEAGQAALNISWHIFYTGSHGMNWESDMNEANKPYYIDIDSELSQS